MVEREAAKDMIVRCSPSAKRITVGADKGFDSADFVADMRDFNVTPQCGAEHKPSPLHHDGRTTHHCGHEIHQQKRRRGHSAGAKPSRLGPCCVASEPTQSVSRVLTADTSSPCA